MFGTSDQNQEITPFQVCRYLEYRKMSFLWSKKAPFEETTSSNDKTNFFTYRKVGLKDIWN